MLATWEAEIRRIMFWGQAKSSQDPISTSGCVWWHIPVIPAIWRSTNKRITVQTGLGIKWDPILKLTSTWKRTEAQVVEHLPTKPVALRSISFTAHNNNDNYNNKEIILQVSTRTSQFPTGEKNIKVGSDFSIITSWIMLSKMGPEDGKASQDVKVWRPKGNMHKCERIKNSETLLNKILDNEGPANDKTCQNNSEVVNPWWQLLFV
jgi:hypothetical protein